MSRRHTPIKYFGLFLLAARLGQIEQDEAAFRDKIEKLRQQAGDSWLTFYNEMHGDRGFDEKVSDFCYFY